MLKVLKCITAGHDHIFKRSCYEDHQTVLSVCDENFWNNAVYHNQSEQSNGRSWRLAVLHSRAESPEVNHRKSFVASWKLREGGPGCKLDSLWNLSRLRHVVTLYCSTYQLLNKGKISQTCGLQRLRISMRSTFTHLVSKAHFDYTFLLAIYTSLIAHTYIWEMSFWFLQLHLQDMFF